MKRRDFISFASLCVAGFSLHPERLLWSPGPVRMLSPLHQCGVLVDHAAKTIVLTRPITVQQMLYTLIDAWDEPDLITDEVPVLSVTPEIAMMNDGWRVEEASISHLLRGSVRQGDDTWTSIAWPKTRTCLLTGTQVADGIGWTRPQKNLNFDNLDDFHVT